nr:retrovirus-related Pol polyprotein from transposon TNT 1-94 [Tanacetum cinerariifolium]
EDKDETETKSKQRKLSFAKVEFVKPNEQVKSPRESVKHEEHNKQAKHPRNTIKVIEVNVVKASASWVLRPKHKVLDHVSRNNGASISFKRFNYVDAQGRSKNLMKDMLHLGEEPNEEKLLVKELLKLNASNDEPQPYSDARKKDDKGVSKESRIDDQEKAKTDREKKFHHRLQQLSFMANLTFADSHNMVAYLEKSTKNADFVEIVNFLNASPIGYALTNGVVERRNRTLVEAARTMLSAAKVPLFFWAEATATACFTQNRSLVIPRHEKTPYHIINDRKPSVKFFYIFGSVCYIVRDGENLNKMKEKGDECIFVGYSNKSRAYRVFNKRTRVIMESIHVNFDELPQMTSDQNSSNLVPECQTMALEHDSLSPGRKCLENVSHGDKT